MYIENEVCIFDFVLALSEAVDLVLPVLNRHHKKVAYVAYHLAKELELPEDTKKDIVLAALVHDIGALSLEERMQIFAADDVEMMDHAELGYCLLMDFAPMQAAAVMIRYHHTPFDPENSNIPMGAHVIHMADKISVLYDEAYEILEQVPIVMEKIEAQKERFHPEVAKALKRLAKLEYFWIEAWHHPDERLLPERIRVNKDVLDMALMRNFARIVAQVVDFRSRFTATHSNGVAAVARELSHLAGFSQQECSMVEIAGFLHDLGKLAVPNDVLEKNGKLDHEEFNIMRKHTYYTYTILCKIKGLESIARWAAFHHERMDGNGYPFHIKGGRLDKLSRIMAVADVFTAITEDRPYRLGMEMEKTMQILDGMVENNGLDGEVVNIVRDHFNQINKIRLHAQEAALRAYESFYAQVKK